MHLSSHENLVKFENDSAYIESSLHRSLLTSKEILFIVSTEIVFPCKPISVKTIKCVPHPYGILNFAKGDNL